MSSAIEVVVIGAGPYGLSIAAHLAQQGTEVLVIGRTMASWRHNMPKGMQLKSAGFASDLSDPHRDFTLERFCSENGHPYHPWRWPVPLEVFCDYGIAFQKRYVRDVRDDTVENLEWHGGFFRLSLRGGERLVARRVVMATGLDAFRRVPNLLTTLPKDCWSHSADVTDPATWQRKRVAVIGAGSSAIDLAVLLHEAGAESMLIVRRPEMEFGEPRKDHRSVFERVRHPVSPIGSGWKNRMSTDLPLVFHRLPASMRNRIVSYHLGPSGGWFIRERAKAVPTMLGHAVEHAHVGDGSLRLTLAGIEGGRRTVTVDHVVAATGYETDLRRLDFLSPALAACIRTYRNKPLLSSLFESSIPSLYFAGVAAAPSFGPLLRFVAGADFTARRLSRALTSPVRMREIGFENSLGRSR